MKQITIGKLSKISGVSPRTIRHYGDIGLLQCAAKTETNYRLYGEEEVRRLEKILLFKNLGFSLDDIYTILFTEENQQVGELFEKRLEDFERQMSEISRYQELLKGIINIYRSYGLEYVDNYHLIKELVGMNNLFVKTFNRLDLELQINVLKEIYHTGSLTPLTLNEIGVESGSQLLRELHLIVVKVLLNKVDRNIERDIILSLEKDDPEFAAEVKKAMFTFEDIIILPDSTIEKWLVRCDDAQLEVALSGCGRYVRNRILNIMSVERSEKIIRNMKAVDTPSLDQVYVAMMNLVDILRQMEMSGEIKIEKFA